MVNERSVTQNAGTSVRPQTISKCQVRDGSFDDNFNEYVRNISNDENASYFDQMSGLAVPLKSAANATKFNRVHLNPNKGTGINYPQTSLDQDKSNIGIDNGSELLQDSYYTTPDVQLFSIGEGENNRQEQ